MEREKKTQNVWAAPDSPFASSHHITFLTYCSSVLLNPFPVSSSHFYSKKKGDKELAMWHTSRTGVLVNICLFTLKSFLSVCFPCTLALKCPCSCACVFHEAPSCFLIPQPTPGSPSTERIGVYEGLIWCQRGEGKDGGRWKMKVKRREVIMHFLDTAYFEERRKGVWGR